MISVSGKNLSAESISTLLDSIHDRWFDLDEVDFSESTGQLRLRLGDRKKGPFDRELTISDVKSYQIEDQAQIGIYDLNDVKIDPKRREIVITSGFPLQMKLLVGEKWEIALRPGHGAPPRADV